MKGWCLVREKTSLDEISISFRFSALTDAPTMRTDQFYCIYPFLHLIPRAKETTKHQQGVSCLIKTAMLPFLHVSSKSQNKIANLSIATRSFLVLSPGWVCPAGNWISVTQGKHLSWCLSILLCQHTCLFSLSLSYATFPCNIHLTIQISEAVYP